MATNLDCDHPLHGLVLVASLGGPHRCSHDGAQGRDLKHEVVVKRHRVLVNQVLLHAADEIVEVLHGDRIFVGEQ